MNKPIKRYLTIDNDYPALEVKDNVIIIDLPHDFINSKNKRTIHWMYSNIFIITNPTAPKPTPEPTPDPDPDTDPEPTPTPTP
jgi:hypothetical protein